MTCIPKQRGYMPHIQDLLNTSAVLCSPGESVRHKCTRAHTFRTRTVVLLNRSLSNLRAVSIDAHGDWWSKRCISVMMAIGRYFAWHVGHLQSGRLRQWLHRYVDSCIYGKGRTLWQWQQRDYKWGSVTLAKTYREAYRTACQYWTLMTFLKRYKTALTRSTSYSFVP